MLNEHSRPKCSQFLHLGCVSSHFTRRRLQVAHPRLDLLCGLRLVNFDCRIEPVLPVLPGSSSTFSIFIVAGEDVRDVLLIESSALSDGSGTCSSDLSYREPVLLGVIVSKQRNTLCICTELFHMHSTIYTLDHKELVATWTNKRQ